MTRRASGSPARHFSFLVFAAGLTFVVLGGCPAPTPPGPVTGDLNEDGVVDSADLDILTAAFGTRAGEPNFIEAADLNGDGVIGLADAQALIDLVDQASGAE